MFSIWSAAAGTPNLAAAAGVSGANEFSLPMSDGKILRGFKVSAGKDALGYVLFAQGNAMLADQVLTHLRAIADIGYDAYVFDYRGYGRSDGRRRLKAIVEDYSEIAQKLNSAEHQYGRRILYGISFGGIVVLSIIGRNVPFDAAIVDSAPSKLSSYGCPAEYDPVRNVPNPASRILFLSGLNDRVVPAKDQTELLAKANDNKADVFVSPAWGHPFMDADPALRKERFERVRAFIDGKPK